MGDDSSNAGSDGWLSRREYVGLEAAAVAGLLAGCNDLAGSDGEDGGDDGTDENGGDGSDDGSDGSDGGPVEATVGVDAAGEGTGDAPVSDRIFGRFAESYGDYEIYPGLYADHVTNNSFADWRNALPDSNGSYLYHEDEVVRHGGVAFPWEPIPESPGGDVSFERPGDAAHDERCQRVSVSGSEGGLRQRIVLPDWRTLGYDLSLSVRGEGIDELEARLTDPDGAVLAATTVAVADDWERHEDVRLELESASGSQFVAGSVANLDTPYGEYALEFGLEGEGHVDLDWITLVPDDAVAGKYNPTTLELMEDRNATLLKWPGGNFTSQYHWRDAVGPVEERSVTPNMAWDGLEPNFFGTAEYVEFCELADVEPTITVGVTTPDSPGGQYDYPAPPEPITPEEAADWVEYCNGSTDTELGALRAEHGYEEPFDIELWEVGNEVWGPWQFGGTDDPASFAEVAREFVDAMKAVDDSITVIVDGMDPGYEESNTPDPDQWNDTLFADVGDRLDGLDIHRYNWGIRDAGERSRWFEENDADGWEYSEILVTFPTQFGNLVSELAADAADAGLEEFQIVVGEWGLFPTVSQGDPWPGMTTMAGAAYAAGMFNAFIRRSEHVRRASHTHMPVRMFPPDAADYPPNPNPLLPTGRTMALYSSVFEDGTEWLPVDPDVGGDTRDVPETGDRIRAMEDVPYVDAVALRAPDDDDLCAFATNRNLRQPCRTSFEFPEAFAGEDATVTIQRPTTDDPHDQQLSLGDYPDSWWEWSGLDAYEVVTENRTVGDDGALEVELAPSAVARVRAGSTASE